MKLANKTILITGASSGIGKAMALRAAQDGATVILVARSLDKLQEVADQVTKLGGKPVIIPTDVSQAAEIKNLFLKATENGRTLDVVFNNAGLGFIGKIWELTADQIASMISVNTMGMIMVGKYAAEVMQRQKYGHLVFTSSLAGLITIPDWSVYVATKWAITGFSECIRYELAPFNVLVTSVHPGMVSTEFFAKEKADQNVSALDKNPLTPEQVVEKVYAALFTKKKKVVIPALSSTFAFVQRYMPGLKDILLNSMTASMKYNKTTPDEDEPDFNYIKEVPVK
jgi:short-subunit dehydrogenase